MSYQLLSETKPVARKEYRCIWCPEKILKGEKHVPTPSREELEAAMNALWNCGLSPTHYPTLKQAAYAVQRLVVGLRRDIDNPRADQCEAILMKAGYCTLLNRVWELEELLKQCAGQQTVNSMDRDKVGRAINELIKPWTLYHNK